MAAFLQDGHLAPFQGMLARRGVTTMAALTAPWLRVAEGFLVDKVGGGMRAVFSRFGTRWFSPLLVWGWVGGAKGQCTHARLFFYAPCLPFHSHSSPPI